FWVRKLSRGGEPVKNRGLEDRSRFILGDFRVSAIENGFCTFAHAGSNQRFDALLAFSGDDRAHLNPCIEAVAETNRGSSMRDGITKRLLRFANGEGDGNRQAALARTAKCALADDLCGQLHIRGRRRDDVGFCPALARTSLDGGCS